MNSPARQVLAVARSGGGARHGGRACGVWNNSQGTAHAKQLTPNRCYTNLEYTIAFPQPVRSGLWRWWGLLQVCTYGSKVTVASTPNIAPTPLAALKMKMGIPVQFRKTVMMEPNAMVDTYSMASARAAGNTCWRAYTAHPSRSSVQLPVADAHRLWRGLVMLMGA